MTGQKSDVISQNTMMYSFIPSPSEGEALHANLTERFKDGLIILDDGDALRYFLVFMGGFIFFSFNNVFWWKLMECLKIKQFMERDYHERLYFNACVSGIVHHVIVATYSLYLLYNSCQNELGYGYPSEKGGSYTSSGLHFGWIRDGVCMTEYNKGYTYNVLMTCSFMTVELIMYKIYTEKLTALERLSIIHHFMALGGFSISLVAGYGMPGLSSASLLCEYSSIFLNLKDMFTKDTRNTFWGIIVQVMFFLTYTIFRFIWFPFLAYRSIAMAILYFNLVTWPRRICMIYCAI